MKNANIKILASLCWALAVTNVHGAYYNPSNEYDSYYDNQRYSDDDYTPRNYAPKKTRSPVVPNDIRFFVSLETTLMSYAQVKITANNSDDEYKQTVTSINYKPFENANFSFGVDSDNGFRFALKIVHYNTETKATGAPGTDTTITGFGGVLDIPFVKLEKTSPFLRFGLNYAIIEDNDLDAQFPMFNIGLGIKHNFSDNIFGVLSAQYYFTTKASVSKIDAYRTENGFSLNLGLGYRF